MTISEFKKHMNFLVGCINFEYNGQDCGIDPLSRTEYDMWYGNDCITVKSVDKLLAARLFDGKTVIDIWDDITDLHY